MFDIGRFSPRIARSSFSSGAKSVSVSGVIFSTKMSSGFTSAQILIMPFLLKFFSASSPIFEIFLVISSGPSFVSRADTSYFYMWIGLKVSSRIIREFKIIAS
jgi:hypothetical protein